jgi:hypothetical protein
MDERARLRAQLNGVISTFRKWFYLPDPGPVEIVLGTVAANHLLGDPVWMLLVGGPSSGKTEPINAASDLDKVIPVSTLTEAALLSASPQKERTRHSTGGLLRQVGAFGILAVKDFTSVLSMNRNTRPALLGALREIYDGSWVRYVGTDGGQTLSWKGKAGLIGGVTSAIDSAHAVMGAMGERFMLYRLGPTDGKKQSEKVMEGIGREQEMRRELAAAMKEFFDHVRLGETNGEACRGEWITSLANLTAVCRSVVDRDSYKREIELIHDREAPGRLTRCLSQLAAGLYSIGLNSKRVQTLVRTVALDSMPPIRRLVVENLAGMPALDLDEISEAIGYPHQTTRRALEDLRCHHVLVNPEAKDDEEKEAEEPKDRKKGTAEGWQMAPDWERQFFQCFSEM